MTTRKLLRRRCAPVWPRRPAVVPPEPRSPPATTAEHLGAVPSRDGLKTERTRALPSERPAIGRP